MSELKDKLATPLEQNPKADGTEPELQQEQLDEVNGGLATVTSKALPGDDKLFY